MKAMEVLLSRRWILKERDKELYYEIRDHIGLMRKFLTEKLGYQMIGESVSCKNRKNSGFSGKLDGNFRI